jgi:lipopolysaccharide biosynthesis regulator YciM
MSTPCIRAVLDGELLQALKAYCPDNYHCKAGHIPAEESYPKCPDCQEWESVHASIRRLEAQR